MPIDFTQFFNPSTWGSWVPGSAAKPLPAAPVGYGGPVGNVGYGVGVGPTGPIPAAPAAQPDSGQGWANMERAGAALVAPANLPPPNLQMARPVGPGKLPPMASMPTFDNPVGPGMSPAQQEFLKKLRQSAFSQPGGFGF
jgi:hypothetical protein